MTKPKTRPPAAPTVIYPPGHFTELVRLHNWPPGFKSQVVVEAWDATDRRAAATRNVERIAEAQALNARGQK